jgi:hypothetical protein
MISRASASGIGSPVTFERYKEPRTKPVSGLLTYDNSDRYTYDLLSLPQSGKDVHRHLDRARR